jgi:ABC-type amino acid transport substrate-binding protein
MVDMGVAAVIGFGSAAWAQDAAVLTGTLKAITDSGTIKLGYRESSLPFSYLNRRGQPLGYSIDLCREVVEETAGELDGMDIKIAFVPVTSANRFDKLKSGDIDVECGSTTSNAQRQKEVAFSPVFFVAGTKLLVRKDSAVISCRDLSGTCRSARISRRSSAFSVSPTEAAAGGWPGCRVALRGCKLRLHGLPAPGNRDT